jgi:hypothetical protein
LRREIEKSLFQLTIRKRQDMVSQSVKVE